MAATTPASGWSRSKKIVVGVFAALAGIGTASGGVKAVGEAWNWWERRSQPQSELEQTQSLGLEFWQGKPKNAMFPVRSSAYEWESVRVSLKREPFEIRIPKHKRAVQICAWTDDSIFQLTEGLSNARPRSEVQFYRPGTGLADSEYYSAILKLSNDAHMYLTGNRLASASPGIRQGVLRNGVECHRRFRRAEADEAANGGPVPHCLC